ncbi:hypothetical protein EVAR_93680_1 [Eumeta japonica]|uniref:Uncharacterized protein n=1 Tax=Eumeta variegata TaxID=151549 RepID=A0A4C1TQQ3_EUMVA|nr:hypothetical protein EVAR_93680_1 [Eumeta japonica]
MQRGIERSMLGVTLKDCKRAIDIISTTKVEDVLKKIRRLKWRWTGHMIRESRMKWTKIITKWLPRDGKRKRELYCGQLDSNRITTTETARPMRYQTLTECGRDEAVSGVAFRLVSKNSGSSLLSPSDKAAALIGGQVPSRVVSY